MRLDSYRIKRRTSTNSAEVTLRGITFFLRRRVECTRYVYHRPDASNRQILVAAGKKTPYRWNIPFWV